MQRSVIAIEAGVFVAGFTENADAFAVAFAAQTLGITLGFGNQLGAGGFGLGAKAAGSAVGSAAAVLIQ